MTPGPFDRFIAVDWSGAKSGYGKKLCVAVCDFGNDAPRLVTCDRDWTREAIANFVLEQPPGTVTGFDFSFAPPFIDRGAYLPGETVPDTAKDFWAHVEAICEQDTDCGAHSFVEKAYRKHFYLGKADGVKADFMRWRQCEQRFNAGGGGKAACVFDAIGAAQVSKASFAGMRVLHRLSRAKLAIWPFDDVADAPSVALEIYCRAFIQHAGLPGGKVRDLSSLNAALAAFGSAPHPGDVFLTDDQTDVLITSAGLRAMAGRADLWAPRGLNAKISRTEGWTFGVF